MVITIDRFGAGRYRVFLREPDGYVLNEVVIADQELPELLRSWGDHIVNPPDPNEELELT